MDDNRIGWKEVNSKKQVRLLDEVLEELDIDLTDENGNGVAFYQTPEDGEILLKGLDL